MFLVKSGSTDTTTNSPTTTNDPLTTTNSPSTTEFWWTTTETGAPTILEPIDGEDGNEAISGISTIALAYLPFAPVYNYLIFKEETSCFVNITTELYWDMKNVLRSLNGLPKDASKNTDTFMCSIDPEFFQNFNTTEWQQQQVIIDTDTITLKDLSAWNIGSTPLEVKPSASEETNGVLSVIISALSLLIFLM